MYEIHRFIFYLFSFLWNIHQIKKPLHISRAYYSYNYSCNIGYYCTSITDCSNRPSWAGNHYQWGRNDMGFTAWQSAAPYSGWWEEQNDAKWGVLSQDYLIHQVILSHEFLFENNECVQHDGIFQLLENLKNFVIQHNYHFVCVMEFLG